MATKNAELEKERKNLIKRILSSDLHGKRIYLLGSAEFGPTNEPKLIKSTTGLYNTFGKQGTLIDAFHAIKYVSKDNYLYLVKTTGQHSTAYMNINIDTGEVIKDGFTLIARDSNEYYNDIKAIIDIDGLTIKYPKFFSDKICHYSFNDYPTIGQLADKINKDAKLYNGYIFAYYSVDPSVETGTAFYPCNTQEIYFYGGQCGINYTKNMLYGYLSRTYSILESEPIDIVIPVDAFLDDIYPCMNNSMEYGSQYYLSNKDYLTDDFNGKQRSFLNQLNEFCIKQLQFGMVTTGIMGYNKNYQENSEYLGEADNLIDMYISCMNWNKECCENPFYTFLISVVAGDIAYNHGTINDNGYLAYASLCSKTIITSGTTNIPISNSIEIHQEFTEEGLSKLSDYGIVSFRHSPLYETPVVYDGVTLATKENHNLKLFCNVRMIQLAISCLNELFQYYIGQDMMYLIHEKIIDSDINNILNALNHKGVITNYDYTISPYYNQNEIKVYLNLQTNYMIKPLTVCSSVDVSFSEEE